MESTIKMGFNISKILTFIKENTKGVMEYELHLNGDSTLRIQNGGLAYYFTQESLQKVLDVNSFQQYYKDETEDLVSELIGKHIINEMYASMGTAYPDIK